MNFSHVWLEIRVPKIGILENLSPEMDSNVNETHKRHIIARVRVRVVLAIKRENLPTCGWVPQKRINLLYFIYSPRSPIGRICTKFGIGISRWRNHHDNFCRSVKRGVEFVWGGEVENQCFPLTKPVWRRCAALLPLPRSRQWWPSYSQQQKKTLHV